MEELQATIAPMRATPFDPDFVPERRPHRRGSSSSSFFTSSFRICRTAPGGPRGLVSTVSLYQPPDTSPYRPRHTTFGRSVLGSGRPLVRRDSLFGVVRSEASHNAGRQSGHHGAFGKLIPEPWTAVLQRMLRGSASHRGILRSARPSQDLTQGYVRISSSIVIGSPRC